MSIQALKKSAYVDPDSVDLNTLDMSEAHRFQDGTHWPLFAPPAARGAGALLPARARSGRSGRSRAMTTSWRVDTDHKRFSSEPVITLVNAHPDPARRNTMFIAMDQPKHTEQRKAVNHAVGPANLAELREADPQRV